MLSKVFHVSRTPPYGQWAIDTHKNIILRGGSSQIDGLEAGDFTFEDSNLIRWMSVVRKCVKTTFYHLIRRESSKVKSPASKPSIWLLPPLRMMFLWVSIGHCPYGGVLDIWSTLGPPYWTLGVVKNVGLIIGVPSELLRQFIKPKSGSCPLCLVGDGMFTQKAT